MHSNTMELVEVVATCIVEKNISAFLLILIEFYLWCFFV